MRENIWKDVGNWELIYREDFGWMDLLTWFKYRELKGMKTIGYSINKYLSLTFGWCQEAFQENIKILKMFNKQNKWLEK